MKNHKKGPSKFANRANTKQDGNSMVLWINEKGNEGKLKMTAGIQVFQEKKEILDFNRSLQIRLLFHKPRDVLEKYPSSHMKNQWK